MAINSLAPYLITGMHRSGTSLLARMLSQLNFDLGSNFIPPDADNPDGYFEDQDIVQIQRRILWNTTPQAGPRCGWPDWGWSIDGCNDQEAISTADHLLATAYLQRRHRSSGKDALWGWKDPRTTILLRFWQSVAPQLRVIAIYRQPWDVVAALYRIKPPVFLANSSWCLSIWEFYNQSLLDFAIENPNQCLLMNAYALARTPNQLQVQLEKKWGIIPADCNLENLVDPRRLRSYPLDDPLELLYRSVFPKACSVYDCLQQNAALPF